MKKTNNVKFGKSSEFLFVSEILKRELAILQPLDESNDFDFVVNGKKVQVRSTKAIKNTRLKYKDKIYTVPRYSCNFPKKNKDIDILVCYIEPINKWYIIPFKELKTKYGSLVVNYNTHVANSYEKYADNWRVFYGKNKPFAK